MTNNKNPLTALSDAMAEAVRVAGAGTIMIDARRRLPASGIAIETDLLVTADHVVEHDSDIKVILPNGEAQKAQVIGRDPSSDLVLLQVDDNVLHKAQRNTNPPSVGQLVLALGRPSTNGIQASMGVVSAIGGPVRTRRGGLLEGYLRTDTIPYPGFSGGPLIDVSGKVLGINTSGLTPGSSLTIPNSLAQKIVDNLRSHGRVPRGYLGIRSQPVSVPPAAFEDLGRSQPSGLLIVSVEVDGPAEKGGLMVGDILVSLGSEHITDADQLLTHLEGSIVGQEIPVEVIRGGKSHTIPVTIGAR
jgi:S1-C subfamily serine protease